MDIPVVMAAVVVAFGIGVGFFLRAGPGLSVLPPPKGTVPEPDKRPPPSVEELLRQADHLIDGGELDKALLKLSQAKVLEPERPGYYFVSARLLQAQGELERAVKEIERACVLRPVANWHGVRGGILLELDRPDLAVEAFKQALEIEPFNAAAAEALGAAEERLAQREG